MHAVPAGSADSVELAGDVCRGGGGVAAAAAAAAAASIAAAAGAEAAIGQRSNTLAHTQRSRHAHAHAQSHTPYATLRVRHLSVTAMRAYACCWMCEVRREALRLLVCRSGAIRARCAARDSRSAARARERAHTHPTRAHILRRARRCRTYATHSQRRTRARDAHARVPVSGM